MNSIIALSASELRRAADIQERIENLQQELDRILNGLSEPGQGEKYKRRMSAAGRARIAAAARARWAKLKNEAAQPAKRTMSAAAKARLSASAKARWKAAKVAGKAKL